MSSVQYSREEIISVSEAGRNLKQLISDLETGEKDRVVITKNGKLKVVFQLIEDYEESQSFLLNELDHYKKTGESYSYEETFS